jgi:hypothetical protein
MALKQKNSSLTEDQIAMISGYGEKLGNLDFSATLRIIIREWQEMKQLRVVAIGELPRPEGAQIVPVVHVQAED